MANPRIGDRADAADFRSAASGTYDDGEVCVLCGLRIGRRPRLTAYYAASGKPLPSGKPAHVCADCAKNVVGAVAFFWLGTRRHDR